MLLPTCCPACGARGAAPCGDCARQLRPAPSLPSPTATDSCAAAIAYEGVGRALVTRLKYRNARSVVPFLADAMAVAATVARADVVTWVPTTATRRRRRGFDQAQVLAVAVARRLGLRCRPLLRRLPGPAQTGRSLAERRRAGPRFGARGRAPGRVLLVDDVVTSGATVTAAARALRAAGSTEVHVVAAARTPGRPTPQAVPMGVHSDVAEHAQGLAGKDRRRAGLLM